MYNMDDTALQSPFSQMRAVIYSQERNVLTPFLGSFIGSGIEVRISSEDLTLANKRVQLQFLWGTDVYTDDSDVVCMLHHTGNLLLSQDAPDYDVIVALRILPALSNYAPSLKNQLLSRSWNIHDGTCWKIQGCKKIPRGTAKNTHFFSELRKRYPNSIESHSLSRVLDPTKELYEIPRLVFSALSCDVCYSYCPLLLMDIAQNRYYGSSTQLALNEVLYIEGRFQNETNLCRFELSNGLQLARIHSPLDKCAFDSYHSVPLSDSSKELLASQFSWSDITWTPKGCMLGKKKIFIEVTALLWRKCRTKNIIRIPRKLLQNSQPSNMVYS